ncbi:uncharacterized protein LOC125738530 [Brienomyrus brachyistius]|uniref:uncharacterized protein LOC125738530 n=1 Tax=Brienomyrus brachyistius TaxID=42636 RepID=UPI0020B1C3B7|nr:uncharacterized protein LOC125738530 [Brienomyrus brachyistius]XP_048863573.1 uncharacterized protein LOC125738530 [Brienomyrus brachyistius]
MHTRSLLIRAVRKNQSSSSVADSEVDSYTIRWFNLASDRGGGRKECARAKEASTECSQCFLFSFRPRLAMTQMLLHTASPKSSSDLETELSEHRKNIVSIARPRHRSKRSAGGSCADNLISVPLIILNEPQHKPTIKCSLLNVHALGNKSLLVHDMVLDTGADMCFLTEPWLRPTDTIPLVEASPEGFSFMQKPHSSGCGGGLAAIFNSWLKIEPKTIDNFTTYEAMLIQIMCDPSIYFLIVYRPPGPYTSYKFGELLTDLVINLEHIIILGDFNIHVDIETDSLSKSFLSLLDSAEGHQHVIGPTHLHNHTLDSVITHGVDVHHVSVH